MMLHAPNRRMDRGSKSRQLIATLDLSYELMLELQNNSYSRYTILKFVCYTFSEYRSTSKRLKHFTFYKIKSRMSETFPFVL